MSGSDTASAAAPLDSAPAGAPGAAEPSASGVLHRCPTTEFEVTAQSIEDYAAAVDDPNPRFRRQGRDASAVVAPRGFASAFMQEPMRRLFADTETMATLGIPGDRVVFGEVEYTFAALLGPGDWVTVEGELVSREAKGDKETLVFRATARRDGGDVVARAKVTLVRR